MARSLLLILLILAVMAGGLVWFDYLGVLDIKTTLAPVYALFGKEGRTQPAAEAGELINLDAERLAIRLEALNLRELEMKKEKDDIEKQRVDNEQVAAELETRQKAIEEKEKSITGNLTQAEARNKNLEQNSRYLTNMPPQNAVNILVAMDDQNVIDVLKKTDEIAAAEGGTSMVSTWLMMMPADRAATLQRKMAERP